MKLFVENFPNSSKRKSCTSFSYTDMWVFLHELGHSSHTGLIWRTLWRPMSRRFCCPFSRCRFHSAVFWVCSMKQPWPVPLPSNLRRWDFQCVLTRLHSCNGITLFTTSAESLQFEAQAKSDVLWHLAISWPNKKSKCSDDSHSSAELEKKVLVISR